MTKLSWDDVEYTIECLPETTPLKGNVLASGDDEEDRRAEDWVREQLEAGNEWAWCVVKVSATLGDFEGIDYLGVCSYESEQDFKDSGYYDDMKAEALASLKSIVARYRDRMSVMPDGGE